MTTSKERSIYNAFLGASFGIGTVIRPIAGCAFASISTGGWRWAFYLNCFVVAATAPIAAFCLPSFTFSQIISIRVKVKRIAILGALLGAKRLATTVTALLLAGAYWKWSYGGTIAMWVVAGAVAICYTLQRYLCILTTPDNCMFELHFFRSRKLVFLFIGSATSTIFIIPLYFIPIFFQFTRNDSALKVGVRTLRIVGPLILGMMLSGTLLPVVARAAPFSLFSGVFSILGAAGLLEAHADTPASYICGLAAVLAFGAGQTAQAGYPLATAWVEPQAVAKVVTFLNFAQIGAGAIVLAVAGKHVPEHWSLLSQPCIDG